MERRREKNVYLTCEKDWVFCTLIAIGGFWGAYTYLLRGRVFCNAQTGNVVLLGMALGAGEWGRALYYLLPISAYMAGALVSELLPNPVKHRLPIRWDTLLILLEMLAVMALGFVPDSAPVQISQVAVNFIASMQYNTFRQSEGVPMATTFVTNHIRQIGIGLAKELRHRKRADKSHRPKWRKHCIMLLGFLGGVVIGTVCCAALGGRAIWLTLLPFSVLLAAFLRADLVTEREKMEQKPAGH